MNLLLLSPDEVDANGTASIDDRRRLQALQHLKPMPGMRLRAGILGGAVGEAEITALDDSSMTLQLQVDTAPPPASPVDLVMALPRPKMLRRLLRCATEAGIKRICLINSYRVEKSYWQSPLLQGPAIRPYLLAGLEQSCDTVLPEVQLERRFRPFVEDRLPALSADRHRLVAHPAATQPCPRLPGEALSLVLGPEGGFIDFEIGLLEAAGYTAVSLGPRILRVETALPLLLGRLG